MNEGGTRLRVKEARTRKDRYRINRRRWGTEKYLRQTERQTDGAREKRESRSVREA